MGQGGIVSTKPEELFMQRMLKTISEYEVACCRDPRTGPRYVHRSCEDALAQLDDLEQRAAIVAQLHEWVQEEIADAAKRKTWRVELAARVGDYGTGDLDMVIEWAQSDATMDDLAREVIEARKEAVNGSRK
jgi:phage shock protein A